MGQGLHDRMTGAQLGLLTGKAQGRIGVVLAQQGFDLLGTVARDEDPMPGSQRSRRHGDVLHHGPTRQRLKDFGHTALHAGAFARSHYHHIDCRHGHLTSF